MQIDAVEIGMHQFWSKAHFMHNLSGKVLQFGVICILHTLFFCTLGRVCFKVICLCNLGSSLAHSAWNLLICEATIPFFRPETEQSETSLELDFELNYLPQLKSYSH